LLGDLGAPNKRHSSHASGIIGQVKKLGITRAFDPGRAAGVNRERALR